MSLLIYLAGSSYSMETYFLGIMFFCFFLYIIILKVGFLPIWLALGALSRSLIKVQTNLIYSHLVVIPVGWLNALSVFDVWVCFRCDQMAL